MPQRTKVFYAILTIVIVHAGGVWGMVWYNQQLFATATPLNLLLCFALLAYTQQERNKAFYIFCAASFVLGYLVEYIGVNTGILFGKYNYLPAMGPQLGNVPIMIGINWASTMLCCGIAMRMTSQAIVEKYSQTTLAKWYKQFGLPVDAALLATFTDVALEPTAVKLQFWQWHHPGGMPPMWNYVCWFGTSLLIMLLFNKLNFRKDNNFAIALLGVQVAFFITINILL